MNDDSDELIRLGEQEGFDTETESIDEQQVCPGWLARHTSNTLKSALYRIEKLQSILAID